MTGANRESVDLVRRHARLGWWLLGVFVLLGLALETMHGLKVGLYLDVSNETRRLMWTLAHAHGALLALVHLAFAWTIDRLESPPPTVRTLASRCLTGASVLMPLGFFLGGVVTHAGDPSLAVLLVPLGAVLLIASIVLTARGCAARG